MINKVGRGKEMCWNASLAGCSLSLYLCDITSLAISRRNISHYILCSGWARAGEILIKWCVCTAMLLLCVSVGSFRQHKLIFKLGDMRVVGNSILILFWRHWACVMTVPRGDSSYKETGKEGSWAKTKFRSKANSSRTWLILLPRIKYCLFTSLIVDLILHRDIHI